NFNFTFPESVHTAWKKMLHFSIGLMDPSRCIPMFGDSQIDHVPSHCKSVALHYAEPEFLWAVTDGKEGHVPSYTSIGFPCIGYYALRSSWGTDAHWLCFDGGRMGQAHYHEDKLNFELYAFGRPFIIDSGVHSYSEHWFREWSVLSAAHNVILVDGIGQCRWRDDRNNGYSAVPLKNRWETDETWDIVEADFSGPYEQDIGSIVQHRRITFHKGELPFWLITDTIEGNGEHDVTELFHFDHDITDLEEIPGGVKTMMTSGANLLLVCFDDLTVTRFHGEMDPPRGWVSPELYCIEKAWEVHFSAKGSLPLIRHFLLLPWQGMIPEELVTEFDTVKSCLTIRCEKQTWTILIPE
ncbi:heparinase II/III-family protein, partial [bacterium AH-315-E10]|nr:heparinase II/III-family protein [bacterium AH-315-E10]